MTLDPRIHDPDYPNPIVEEIRAIKHKLAAECDNDITKILKQARENQEADDRTYITLPPQSISKAPLPPLDTANDSSVNQPTK